MKKAALISAISLIMALAAFLTIMSLKKRANNNTEKEEEMAE